MKVLVVSSRFPWPPHTGDRLRALIWLEALDESASVTLVAPVGRDERREARDERREERDERREARDDAATLSSRAGGGAGKRGISDSVRCGPSASVHTVPVRRSPAALFRAAVGTLRDGLPFHALVAAGFDWRGALRRAETEHGPFDAAVILLSRAEPWVRDSIHAPRTILDAIDALSLSMEERAKTAPFPLRSIWNLDARRTARLETRLAANYDRRLVVVSESDRRRFGDRAIVVSNGVEILTRTPAGGRRFDFGFWGNLRYFANADALRWLLDEIWPRVRAAHPSATLLVAGAEAPRRLLRLGGTSGISVVSPMDDRPALLRHVGIALLPLRAGSGHSNKVLEAAEASCAIVATPTALRGLSGFEEAAMTASDSDGLARLAIDLRRNAAEVSNRGDAARQVVEKQHSREATCARLAELLFEV